MAARIGLDRILGPEHAAALIHQLAGELAQQDGLDPDRAFRLACERVCDGDPLLLAAAGQTWQRADDVHPDDVPAEQLLVTGRLTCPPRILVRADDGEEDELLIEALELYDLVAWQTADTLLDADRA